MLKLNKAIELLSSEVAKKLASGEIKKKTGDQKTRLGVKGDPLTDLAANLAWPICHMKVQGGAGSCGPWFG